LCNATCKLRCRERRLPFPSRRLDSEPLSLTAQPPVRPQAPPPSVERPTGPEHLDGGARRLAMLAICLGMVISGIDGMIVNVALPTIAREFHASASTSIWTATVYQLAVIVGLLPFAALGETHGYKRVYLVGMAVFTLASAGCAFAFNLPTLLIARAVQGLGGSAMIGVSLAMVRFVYPPARLGSGIALYGMTAAASLTLAPSIAAAVLALKPWPWLFLINLPIGAVALALGVKHLPSPPRRAGGLDLLGALLCAAAFVAVVSAVDAVGDVGKLWWAGVLAIGAAAAGILLVAHQRRKPAPLLPLDLLAAPSFALAAATSVCTYWSNTAAFVSLPFLFQHDLGHSAAQTGLLMIPWPLMVASSGFVSGRLADRAPPGATTAIGMALVATGLVLLSLLSRGAPTLAIVLPMALCGLGGGLFQAPNNKTLMTSAPPHRAGAASGMVAVARMLGVSLGSATAGMALGLFGGGGPVAALRIAACLAATACLLSLSRAVQGRGPPASV
jgi:DHA2 family multidrug resistance protein-like MFS transporter